MEPGGLHVDERRVALRVKIIDAFPHIIPEACLERFSDVEMSDNNVVVVTTEEHQVPRAIFDIGNTGVHVLEIDIRKPTLEDVFLQIARGDGYGG